MTARLAVVATTLLLLGSVAQAAPLTPTADGLSEPLRVLAQAAGSTATVRTAYANLRAEPTTKSPKVGEVKQGQKLEVIKTEGDWVQIKQPGDKTAYVNRKLLNK